jgi:cytochrome c-type biogenesis protein CcmF
VGATNLRGPNYDAVQGTVEVTRGGKPVTVLQPQKRHFWVHQTDNSKAAISVGWARDLFVAMGDPLGANAWSMRIQYKPLVRYIWLGAIVMALGGLIAATDRRYRVKVPVAAQGMVSPPNPRAELGSA